MSQSNAKTGKYLTFQIRNEVYGVSIEAVREINSMTEVTPVPQVPPFVKGVINLRGKVISVIDLRLRLGIEAGEYTRNTCIIVIDARGGQLGVIVDTVREVQDISDDQLEGPPSYGSNKSEDQFLIGMGKVEKQVIMLLDLTEALTAEQVTEIAASASDAVVKGARSEAIAASQEGAA